ncbi:MAG: hypothetical protein ILO34_00240 [Kiritimatiellae bacterium]|nr:hypothetical protein [Kiritimatiellia bacterium]
MNRIAAAFALAMLSFAAVAKDKDVVVCETCKDSGEIKETCKLCRGTKYVWKCNKPDTTSRRGRIVVHDWEEEQNARANEKGSEFCGYGSTYKPIHKACKGTRKRMSCPGCAAGKSKSKSTGKVSVPCPDCDGKGHLKTTYYLVRDSRWISPEEKEYVFEKMDKPGTGPDKRVRPNVFKRKMTGEQLEDFKVINQDGKAFTSLDELKEFIKNNKTRIVTNPTAFRDGVDETGRRKPAQKAPEMSEEEFQLQMEADEADMEETFRRKYGGQADE